jgi:putative copper export protein
VPAVLVPSFDTFRLALHVLAAAVWVGGQVTMAGLVPALRTVEGAPRAAARAFARVAWPAFAVSVITGIWNVFEVDMAAAATPYHLTLGIKVLLVVAVGLSAWYHGITSDRRVLAATGALSAVGSIGALFLGVLLRTPA